MYQHPRFSSYSPHPGGLAITASWEVCAVLFAVSNAPHRNQNREWHCWSVPKKSARMNPALLLQEILIAF